jgi:hypothetical protein
MLYRVTPARTEVSDELSASIIKVTRIDELGKTSSSQILVTHMMEALCSSETSALAGVTGRNFLEDGIHHSHRRENLKSYTALV